MTHFYFSWRRRAAEGAIAALTVLAVVLTAAGCGKSHPEASAGPAAGAAAPVAASDDVKVPANSQGIETVIAQSQPIVATVVAPARIVPDPARVIHVYPPAGGRLLTVTVHPGDLVRKGQVLATLQSSDAVSALSDYQKAQTDLALKQKALLRAQELKEHGALAERDLQQAQADAQMAQASLAAASSRLQVLGINPDVPLHVLDVLAPRAGAVLDTGAAPGELSKAQDAPQPLCTIADLTEVWAEGDIFEKDINAVHVGDEAQVELTAFPGKQWTARVTNVSYALDPTTRTLKVRVVLPNPGLKLKPDMFASIKLSAVTHAGIVLPSSALLTVGDQSYVFVRKSADTFTRRQVTVQPVDGSQLEITAGLSGGEAVVVQGVLLLRDAGS
jgi:membrane fusion protein, heavy metal efflux system